VLEELTSRLPSLALADQDWRYDANVSFRGPSALLVR
jgi:hypothetical protein